MDLLHLARRRKTVRRFSGEKVDMDDLLHCIEVAREAPSGMNMQPWRFLILGDGERKRKVREICERAERDFHERAWEELRRWMAERKITWKKDFLEDAPLLLLVFSWRRAPYFIQSTWLMIGYLLLALEEKGLATVTYTPPNPREIEKFLEVDDDYKLEVILPVGYSADEKRREGRRDVKEMIYMERWGAGMR